MSITLDLSNPLTSKVNYITSNFPAGEVFIRITPFEIQPVKIIARLNSSNDIVRLMMTVDALKRLGVREISCVIPYLNYSRQDRVCNRGEAHSLKVFADLINSLNFESVVTWDAHSIVAEGLFNNLVNISNEKFIDYVLKDIGPKPLNIVFPDLGASKKIDSILPVFEGREINVLVCGKDRDPKTTNILGTYVPPIYNDWDFLIIDDLVDGGKTPIELAKEIQNRRIGLPIGKLYLATTHGIYSKGFEVFEPYFNKLYCTNSIRDIENPLVKQFSLFD